MFFSWVYDRNKIIYGIFVFRSDLAKFKIDEEILKDRAKIKAVSDVSFLKESTLKNKTQDLNHLKNSLIKDGGESKNVSNSNFYGKSTTHNFSKN